MLYVTLAEAKSYLNVSSTGSDAEVTDFANTAENIVLGITGPVLSPGVRTVTVVPWRGTVVLGGPALSVTSVVTGTGIAVTGWVADLGAGLVEGVATWDAVTVTYVADQTPPEDLIRSAILLVLGRLWETQRGNAPAVMAGGEGSLFTPGMGGIITEVRSMLTAGGVRPVVA